MPREQTWELFPSDMYKKANKCKFNEFVRAGLRSESVLRQHLSNYISGLRHVFEILPIFLNVNIPFLSKLSIYRGPSALLYAYLQD